MKGAGNGVTKVGASADMPRDASDGRVSGLVINAIRLKLVLKWRRGPYLKERIHFNET